MSPSARFSPTRSSPVRSPRRVKKDAASSPKRKGDLINEVREQLSMPMAPSLVDEDQSVVSIQDEDDSCNSVRDDDDARSQQSVTSANTAANSGRHSTTINPTKKQSLPAPAPPRSPSSGDSVNSTTSTKSTRSIFTRFSRKKKPKTTSTDDDGDDAVTVSSTKSWWKRGGSNQKRKNKETTQQPQQQQQPPPRKTIFQSFRLKKKKRRNGRGAANDQLVADFFDVQSVASVPDFVGSNQMKNVRLNADDIALGSSHLLKLETRSVTSARSQRSTGFASFFLRLRGKGDPDAMPEYEPGFPPYRSLIGNSIDAADDDVYCDYDEEITLGSGFENMSLADSLDDSSVASDGTTQSKRSNGSYTSRGSRNSKSSARSLALAEQEQRQSPTKNKSSFLQRILSKNSGGQNDAIIRKAIGVSSACTLSETESDEADAPQKSASTTAGASTSSQLGDKGDNASTSKKSTPVRRGKSLMHGSMKARSSKSLDGYPCVADIHSHNHRTHQDIVGPREINLRKDPPPPPISTTTRCVASKKAVKDEEDDDDSETTKTTAVDSSGLNRWSCDASESSDSTLPKRPQRQTSSSETEQSGSEEEDKDDSTAAARPKKPTASQSMRNLHVDDEVDDESILSLLGSLLATWAAEREGAADEVATICTVDRDDYNDNSGEGRPKGILKTPSSSPPSSPREDKEEEQRDPGSVIFDRVEIREYERVVGDNPSTARGPPISIGWLYKLAKVCPLDDYETMIRGPRRSKKEFHLSAEKRTHLLVEEWKCSEDDIRKARREATYIQYCRAKTSFSGSRVAAKEAAFLRKANDFRMQQQQGTIMLSGTMPLDAPTSPSKSPINSPRPKVALTAPLVGSSPKPSPRVKALALRPPPIAPVTNLKALPVVSPERTVRTLSPSPNAAPKTERPRALLEV